MEEIDNPADNQPVIDAELTADQILCAIPQTKTALDENLNVIWSENDEVMVLGADNQTGIYKFNSYVADDNKTAAVFENVDTKVNYKTNIVGNIQLGKVRVQAASLVEFKNAIANPQVTSIELTAPITISEDIEINGHGVIVKQPATWNHAESTPIITIQHANVTLKNIHFKDTYKAPLIDVYSQVNDNGDYKDFILDNITVTGHNTAVGPMITLRGKAEITNCHFKDNICAGNSLICFKAGTGGLIFTDNNLINNTVQTSDTNAAIFYITNRPNCKIENNTITGNQPNNEIK
jgi:hypothetical protein